MQSRHTCDAMITVVCGAEKSYVVVVISYVVAMITEVCMAQRSHTLLL